MSDDLTTLQTWFSGLLVEPRAYVDQRTARQHLKSGGRLDPLEQIEVYREQFWLRHTAALLEDFPGLSRLLGQAEWQAFAEDYLQHFPPRTPLLRDLGHGVTAHLRNERTRSRFDSAVHPADLLEDMAALEWAHIECFDAADQEAFDISRLDENFDWDHAELVLSPASRLLRLRYPVTELRRSLMTGAEPTQPAPGHYHVMIHRSAEGSLWDLALPGPIFELLGLLQTRSPLAAACQQVVEKNPSAASFFDTELGPWFARMGALGLIVDVKPTTA